MMVLSAVPDIEIVCTDSSECFDSNKAYLHDRLDDETNPNVRRLIERDIESLDSIGTEMAAARQSPTAGLRRDALPISPNSNQAVLNAVRLCPMCS